MKNGLHMKNGFIQMLAELGIVLKFLINGLIGGFIWSLYKKSKFWESVRQILIGGIVAGYLTPVLSDKFSLDESQTGFMSFTVGMTGMVIIDSVYKYVKMRSTKWRLAFVEFVKKLF